MTILTTPIAKSRFGSEVIFREALQIWYDNPTEILLLRGFARDARHWGEFPQFLETKLQIKVHCIDLPGTGRNADQESPITVKEIVAAVRGQAQNEKLLNQPLCLVGVSLGGMVALQWIHQNPAEIQCAFVMNSSMASLCPFYKRLRIQVWKNFLTAMMKKDVLARERDLLSIVSARTSIHQSVGQKWASWGHEFTISRSNAARQMMAAAKFSIPDIKPQLKVTLAVGQADQLVDPSCSQKIHQKTGWPLFIHPWAGHDLSLDDPEWVGQRLKNLLQSKKNFTF